MHSFPVTISPLRDFPEAVPSLARWFHAQWYRFDACSIASIESQLAENFNQDRIPITFVAVRKSQPVGTVSIDVTDLPSYDHLSPWMASLYVAPEARGAGLGSRLVHHVQDFVAAHGLSPIYLWAPASTTLYERSGWAIHTRTTYGSRPITIMRWAN